MTPDSETSYFNNWFSIEKVEKESGMRIRCVEKYIDAEQLFIAISTIKEKSRIKFCIRILKPEGAHEMISYILGEYSCIFCKMHGVSRVWKSAKTYYVPCSVIDDAVWGEKGWEGFSSGQTDSDMSKAWKQCS